MTTLKEFKKQYPSWFAKPHCGYHCPAGWEQALCTALDIISHKYKRWAQVERIRDSLIKKGLLNPSHKDYNRYKWALEYFEKHPVNPYEKFHIDQLKVKFGEPRFYWSMETHDLAAYAYVSGAMTMAEYTARKICNICGNPGYIDGFHICCTIHHSLKENLNKS